MYSNSHRKFFHYYLKLVRSVKKFKMGKNKKRFSEFNCKNIKSSEDESPPVISLISSNEAKVKSDLQKVTESVIKNSNELVQASFNCEDLQELKNVIMYVRSQIDNLFNKVIGIELKLEKHAEIIISSSEKCRNSSNESIENDRENTIIVHGLSKYINREENLSLQFKDFISQILGVTLKYVHATPLGLNSYKLRLDSKRSKLMIFKNCHKLKALNDKVSFIEDIDESERSIRMEKMSLMMQEKSKGNKVYFRGSDLFVNDKLYHKSNASKETMKPEIPMNKRNTKYVMEQPVKPDCAPKKKLNVN